MIYVLAFVLLIAGYLLFVQWRKARDAQNRKAAMIWMIASMVVSLTGLFLLLAGILMQLLALFLATGI